MKRDVKIIVSFMVIAILLVVAALVIQTNITSTPKSTPELVTITFVLQGTGSVLWKDLTANGNTVVNGHGTGLKPEGVIFSDTYSKNITIPIGDELNILATPISGYQFSDFGFRFTPEPGVSIPDIAWLITTNPYQFSADDLTITVNFA